MVNFKHSNYTVYIKVYGKGLNLPLLNLVLYKSLLILAVYLSSPLKYQLPLPVLLKPRLGCTNQLLPLEPQ